MEFCKKCGTIYKITDEELDSEKNQEGGSKSYNDIIQALLEDQNVIEIINTIDIKKFKNSSEYNKLDIETIEFLNNKIEDTLSFSKKKISKKDIQKPYKTNRIFFQCIDCTYYEEIKPKTLIYSESKKKKVNNLKRYDYMVNNPILPRTKKYICPNNSCKSHVDDNAKEAVFMRDRGNVIYICVFCKYNWML